MPGSGGTNRERGHQFPHPSHSAGSAGRPGIGAGHSRAAAQAHSRGLDLLHQVEREHRLATAIAKSHDKAAATSLADRLRSWTGGEKPRIGATDKQLAARHDLAEAEATLEQAKEAHGVLADELEQATQALQEAEKAVDAAIAAIVREEAEDLAARLAAARAEVRAIEAAIHGLGLKQGGGLPGQPGRLEYLPRQAVTTLHEPAPKIDQSSTEARQEYGRWAEYITALRQTPDAIRTDITLPPPTMPLSIAAVVAGPRLRCEEGHRLVPVA